MRVDTITTPITTLTLALAIMAERDRQIAKGYDAAHDDTHVSGALLRGAIAKCYSVDGQDVIAHRLWPFTDDTQPFNGTPRERLIQAAAMLIAEIERLERAVLTANHSLLGDPT